MHELNDLTLCHSMKIVLSSPRYSLKNNIVSHISDIRLWRRRKARGGDRRKFYTEGWVEFSDKRIAKRTATMLNGETMGGQ